LGHGGRAERGVKEADDDDQGEGWRGSVVDQGSSRRKDGMDGAVEDEEKDRIKDRMREYEVRSLRSVEVALSWLLVISKLVRRDWVEGA